MTFLKRATFRIFDACLISMLIWGDSNMQTFGLFVAAIFTVVAWVGMFGMKPHSAKEIHGTLGRRVVGVIVNLGYTYALIVSGSPVWAAFYIMGFAGARVAAARIVSEKGGA